MAALLAHLIECQSADQEVASLNPGRSNPQGLKITEDEDAAFASTSASG